MSEKVFHGSPKVFDAKTANPRENERINEYGETIFAEDAFIQSCYIIEDMDFIKKNLILLLAFALPIIFVVGVAVSVELSDRQPTTSYNFVYATCSDSYSPYCNNYLQKRFSVIDDKITVNEIATSTLTDFKEPMPENFNNYMPRLFLYDVQTKDSREITLTEAENLSLSGLLTSPDGYTISGEYTRNGGDAFFVFGGYSSYGYYLKKGDEKKRLNLINDNGNYYEDNFRLIGWVLPVVTERN